MWMRLGMVGQPTNEESYNLLVTNTKCCTSSGALGRTKVEILTVNT